MMIKIVGTTFTKIKPSDLGLTSDNSKIKIDGYLKPEPDNPYDSDAVAVYTNDDKMVGHLPKGMNASLHLTQPTNIEIECQTYSNGYNPSYIAYLPN